MFISFIYVSGERDFSPLLKYYIAATSRVFVEFKDTARNIELIDTGVEINIIMLDLARRAGFPIRDGSKFINMISQIGHSREFYRVIEKIFIKIGLTINTVSIWVMEKINNELVLGISYIHVFRITQKTDSDGLMILILSDDNKTIVRFLNALIQDTRN